MAKRLTPLERAIAGEPSDRQARYLKSLASKGMHRTTVTVPRGKLDELRAIVQRWRDEAVRDD